MALSILVCLLAVAAPACSSVEPGVSPTSTLAVVLDVDAARAALDEAQRRWSASGITGYTLAYSYRCNCPASGRWTFEVVNGSSISARAPQDGVVRENVELILGPTTVENLFDVIAEALDQPVDLFTIEYADEGYPTGIAFDDANAIDDGFGFSKVIVTPTL